MVKNGLVVKCVGGLYQIILDNGETVSCYARGLFRRDSFSPTAGDRVSVDYDGATPVLAEVFPRRNCLVRPFVANIDRLLLVFSAREPGFNPLLLDKMLAIAEFSKIDCAVVITKSDLAQADKYVGIYRKIGYPCISLCGKDSEQAKSLSGLLVKGINLLCGNSGVGKTTLLNSYTGMNKQTAEISQKLGRGRHTTREAELYPLGDGSYIADTPGFSSVNIEAMRLDMDLTDLANCFAEFKRLSADCRFDDCAHVGEPGCAVRDAVESGEAAKSRYESYLALREELKAIKKY